ncbi:unnamed protein product [Rhizoctonia solani]|uniref:F-box domain-containing protein n=1 Tax=Rhizoctonia solani TaxID=456999 RepID=A0A8H3GVC1_9AGAM|nr:unnamed protein product [Rhizoctonia solani]
MITGPWTRVFGSRHQMSNTSDQPSVSKEGHQENSHEHASKRARTSASAQSAPPKKRIKGKQGGLQGIMNMPIEVFMEIAPYLNPGDLISLIRTSKFFRTMLLNRSAAPVWQRSLSNAPDLPPCPTEMMEPQYAALIFTKNCTICGALAVSSKPDPYLRVRLCPACRDRELVERSLYNYSGSGNTVPFTLHIKKFKKKRSFYKNPVYILHAQEQEYQRARSEFLSKNDTAGYTEWHKQRLAAWVIQQKEGDELLKYINSAAESRSTELYDLKVERREQIHERLKTQGWDEKYFDFWWAGSNARKQWHTLVEVSKSLTERTWSNILPKLTQLLEDNRLLVDEHERKQRLSERVSYVENLLRKFKKQTDPYRAIVDALQQASNLNELGKITSQEIRLSAPFPGETVLASWNILTDLYLDEHSRERIEELFDEREDTIGQKLSEWRSKIEAQLVAQYTSSFNQTNSQLNHTLTIKGSPNAAKGLSKNAQFLLRADTVFMEAGVPTCYNEVDQEHGPICQSIHFPDIHFIQNYARLYQYRADPDPDKETRSLEAYIRHAGKEVIAKALLRDLNMPDVAYIELKYMGEVFICGRCYGSKATGWREIVEHYHSKKRDWVGGRYVLNEFTTKQPVTFRNVHDLTPESSSKPLVHIGNTDILGDTVARCLICHHCYESYSYVHSVRFQSLEQVKEHMLEMHDATEPIEGLHFSYESHFWALQRELPNSRGNWEKKWDEYHDGQSAADGEPST